VWDKWTRQYDNSIQCSPVIRRVTEEQYNYCISKKARITGAGGRGGGKSEALAQRCEYLAVTIPGSAGLVVSPDYDHTLIIWRKLLERVHRITMPGKIGVHITNRMITLVNGSTIRFRSANHPDSLRGWDAHWLAIDEEKDVPDEAIDISMLCLRLARKPFIFGAGTPEIGEYSDRYERLKELDDAEVFTFPSRDNAFIPHAVFDLAAKLMDERRYRQEVLAEFVRMDEDAIVCKGFDRNLHKIDVLKLGKRDITREFTRSKLRKGFGFIIGVDYNHDTPCVAWVYRIYEGGIWVAVDIIKAPDPSWKLAKDIKAAGYDPRDCIVIDDGSAEWQDGRGSRSPNSSRRHMREHGFTCINPDPSYKKNPSVRSRIDALTCKLAPANGAAPTWFYAERLGRRVYDVMENQTWASSGWTMDKSVGHVHDIDAATYPLYRLAPAASLPSKPGGIVAK
jgi:hypothetical protein